MAPLKTIDNVEKSRKEGGASGSREEKGKEYFFLPKRIRQSINRDSKRWGRPTHVDVITLWAVGKSGKLKKMPYYGVAYKKQGLIRKVYYNQRGETINALPPGVGAEVKRFALGDKGFKEVKSGFSLFSDEESLRQLSYFLQASYDPELVSVENLGMEGLPSSWEKHLCCKGYGFPLTEESLRASVGGKVGLKTSNKALPIAVLKEGKRLKYFYYNEGKGWKPAFGIVAAYLFYPKTGEKKVQKSLRKGVEQLRKVSEMVVNEFSRMGYMPAGAVLSERERNGKRRVGKGRKGKNPLDSMDKHFEDYLGLIRRAFRPIKEEWESREAKVFFLNLPLIVYNPGEDDGALVTLPAIFKYNPETQAVEEMAVLVGGEVIREKNPNRLAKKIAERAGASGYYHLTFWPSHAGDGLFSLVPTKAIYLDPNWDVLKVVGETTGGKYVVDLISALSKGDLVGAGRAGGRLAWEGVVLLLPYGRIAKPLSKTGPLGKWLSKALEERSIWETVANRVSLWLFVGKPLLDEMEAATSWKERALALAKAISVVGAFPLGGTLGQAAGGGLKGGAIMLLTDAGAFWSIDSIFEKLGIKSREAAKEELRKWEEEILHAVEGVSITDGGTVEGVLAVTNRYLVLLFAYFAKYGFERELAEEGLKVIESVLNTVRNVSFPGKSVGAHYKEVLEVYQRAAKILRKEVKADTSTTP